MEILFATKNPAKIDYYKTALEKRGMKIYTLREKHVDNTVEETGKTAIENAILKAKAYYEQTHLKTIAIDDTLYIEGVTEEEQPGAKVRRIGGIERTDDEMLAHYTALVHKYGGRLTAKWVKGVAIYDGKDLRTHTVEGIPFYFVEAISPVRHEGYPLDSITIIPEQNKYLSEMKKEEYENRQKGSSSSKQILDFIEQNIE